MEAMKNVYKLTNEGGGDIQNNFFYLFERS